MGRTNGEGHPQRRSSQRWRGDSSFKAASQLLSSVIVRGEEEEEEPFIAFPVDISVARRHPSAALCRHRAASVGTVFK